MPTSDSTSFYDLLPAAARVLELSGSPFLALTTLAELSVRRFLPFPPSAAALVAGVEDRAAALELRAALKPVYPDDFILRLAVPDGAGGLRVEACRLDALETSPGLCPGTLVEIPPLGPDTSLEAFQEVVAHLRAPDGCPWDREQTHASLRTHLVEETYEAVEAIDQGDPAGLCEELGDLLLQIILHAQIAFEAGEFNFADVTGGIHRKIVRRHPHVFGEVQVSGVSGVLSNWEKLKEAERRARGEQVKGLLDGVPRALPALLQAQEIQDRARRVGFDWDEIGPVLLKVEEELAELRAAASPDERERELGDLLFAVTNLARWYKIDAESALRETGARFRRRFAHIEKRAREQGRALSEMTLAEMDVFWDEAKRLEK